MSERFVTLSAATNRFCWVQLGGAMVVARCKLDVVGAKTISYRIEDFAV